MKHIRILILILSPVFCQQLTQGEKCECIELITEHDCQFFGSCDWDPVNMKCSLTTQLLTTRYSLENIQGDEASQSFSFYCELYRKPECSTKKSCAWFKNSCTFFTGCTAYLRSTHHECQEISSRCISDGTRCVKISDCSTYKHQLACTKDAIGQYCYWNHNLRECELPDDCQKLPKTFLTHIECHTTLNYCTVKDGGGCISMGYSCSNQSTESSCITNIDNSKQCFWVNEQCLERLCDNAQLSLQTDKQCKQFLSECTTKLGGGCIKRQNCSDALIQEACINNDKGEYCIWNGKQCLDHMCENAPQYYVTNDQCQQIHQICITNGNGCIANYACNFTTKKEYCIKDGDGNECFWNGQHCVLKSCSSANDNYVGNQVCSNFKSTCTGKPDGQKGCLEKTCSNAPTVLGKNEDCESYFPQGNCIVKKGGGCRINTSCTFIDMEEGCKIDINGTLCQWNNLDGKCIIITSCASILSENQCVKDNKGQLCQWTISDKQIEQCKLKICSTAPKSLQSEKQCQVYHTPKDGSSCTTQQNGGCKTKATCQEANCKESCLTDKNGNECIWDEIVSLCRMKQCNDIKETSFFACQQANKSCTIGYSGCDSMKKCREITNKYQCLQGQDGPCLWISNYEVQGACFQFESCNSMKFKTDAECKLVSNYCTTNGEHCIPLSSCDQTNTTGGCVTGTDGVCIVTNKALGQQEPKFCEKFFYCSRAFYLTHAQCQEANRFCTTNGTTGCRDLNSCETYVKQGCYFNNIGALKNISGHIISTGKCIWDEYKNQCRNQSCQDLQYSQEAQCSRTLFSCTTDGMKCIQKSYCSRYEKSICSIAQGIEGICYWDNQICQPLTCQAIPNGSIQSVCSIVDNCISDGLKCIGKQQCAYYKTKIVCSQNGTDGICIWLEQHCILMTDCQSANNDQQACNSARDRCHWVQSNNLSLCLEHSCETFYNEVGDCKYFAKWDKQHYNICKMKNMECTFFDVTTLDEEQCLTYAEYKYKWNPISKKCAPCESQHNIKEFGKKIGTNNSAFPKTNFSYLIFIPIWLSIWMG